MNRQSHNQQPQEFASYESIKLLYQTTVNWLEDNGSLTFDQGRDILGSYDGAPLVKKFAPDYEFIVPWHVIRNQAPQFVEVFDLEEESPLRINRFIKCFLVDDEVLQYGVDPDREDARLTFQFNERESYWSRGDCLELFEASALGGLIRVSRRHEEITGQKLQRTELLDLDQGDAGSVTREEYDALASVASMLYANDPDLLTDEPTWMDKLRLGPQ